jgi:hypothetical protein
MQDRMHLELERSERVAQLVACGRKCLIADAYCALRRCVGSRASQRLGCVIG